MCSSIRFLLLIAVVSVVTALPAKETKESPFDDLLDEVLELKSDVLEVRELLEKKDVKGHPCDTHNGGCGKRACLKLGGEALCSDEVERPLKDTKEEELSGKNDATEVESPLKDIEEEVNDEGISTPEAITACVGSHNKLRALHQNTPNVEWDDSLAARAQSYADTLVAINKASATTQLIHESPADGMGENLYWADNQKVKTCAEATLAWYEEIKDYSYATAGSKNGKAVGHFTQVVWKNSVRIGVGIATMPSRKYAKYGNKETFIVAKYSPQGNFYMRGRKLQHYTANVQPRKPGAKTPTIEELDPSLKQPCADARTDGGCEWLLNNGYTCKGNYKNYFKQNCFKSCKYC